MNTKPAPQPPPFGLVDRLLLVLLALTLVSLVLAVNVMLKMISP